jgi:hypothetical protein
MRNEPPKTSLPWVKPGNFLYADELSSLPFGVKSQHGFAPRRHEEISRGGELAVRAFPAVDELCGELIRTGSFCL